MEIIVRKLGSDIERKDFMGPHFPVRIRSTEVATVPFNISQ